MLLLKINAWPCYVLDRLCVNDRLLAWKARGSCLDSSSIHLGDWLGSPRKNCQGFLNCPSVQSYLLFFFYLFPITAPISAATDGAARIFFLPPYTEARGFDPTSVSRVAIFTSGIFSSQEEKNGSVVWGRKSTLGKKYHHPRSLQQHHVCLLIRRPPLVCNFAHLSPTELEMVAAFEIYWQYDWLQVVGLFLKLNWKNSFVST